MELASKIYKQPIYNESTIFFQPKLTINNPNDKFETEADAVADIVMQMETPSLQTKADNNPFFKPNPISITPVQRKCTHCEDDEKMQRKEIDGEEATADSSLENYVGSLSSSGQPLPDEVRSFYEPRFGYDFSNVKVRPDNISAKSAQSINALAYTSGNNIVFNNAQYAPNTDSGKKLLGHELTHVVQQGSSVQAKQIQMQHHANDSFSTGFSGEKFWVAIEDCIAPFLEGVNSVLIFLCIFLIGITVMAAALEVELAAAFAAFAATTSGQYIIAAFAALGLTSALSLITESIIIFYRTVEAATSRSELESAGRTFCRNMGEGITEAVLIIMPLIRTLPARLLSLFGVSGGRTAVARMFRLLSLRAIRYSGRIIVVVETSEGPQGFYRRTGLGSGGASHSGAQAGDWAPFDGIIGGWFNKTRYTSMPETDTLFRFGTEEFRDISLWLNEQTIVVETIIPEGEFASVNTFLETYGVQL